MIRAMIVAGLWVVAMTPAMAQDVQRCEGGDGSATYANGPCPPGTRSVRTLPPTATPSAADQAAAAKRAWQDAGKVAAIERDKKAEEGRAAREQERADKEAKKSAAQCRRLDLQLRQAEEELASATLNKRAEAQRRAQRAKALYVQECGARAR